MLVFCYAIKVLVHIPSTESSHSSSFFAPERGGPLLAGGGPLGAAVAPGLGPLEPLETGGRRILEPLGWASGDLAATGVVLVVVDDAVDDEAGVLGGSVVTGRDRPYVVVTSNKSSRSSSRDAVIKMIEPREQLVRTPCNSGVSHLVFHDTPAHSTKNTPLAVQCMPCYVMSSMHYLASPHPANRQLS